MTLHVQWCKAHRKSKDTTTLIFCPMCLVEELERTEKPQASDIPEGKKPMTLGQIIEAAKDEELARVIGIIETWDAAKFSSMELCDIVDALEPKR